MRAAFYKSDRALAAAVLLVTFVCYLPAPDNALLMTWDDQGYITDNPIVKSLSAKNIATIFREDMSGTYMANYHPLTTLSYAVNYALWGERPSGYILTNLLLHLLATLLVFLLVKRLVRGPATSRFVPAFTALWFGIHPMHVESVAWISERKDVLYVTFFLAAMLAWIRYLDTKQLKWYAAVLLLFVCSVLSKAVGVVLPAALLLTDHFLQRKWQAKVLLDKIPFLAIAVWAGLMAMNTQSEQGALNDLFTFGQKIMHASYGTVMYIVKFFVPSGLSAFYPYPYPLAGKAWVIAATPKEFYVTLPLALAAGALGLVLLLKKGFAARTAAFGLIFYLVTLAPVSQIMPVGRVIMADRYAYLPYLGLAFLTGSLLHLWMKKQPKATGFLGVIIAACALIFCQATFRRCNVWEHDETLWTDVIIKYPNDNRVKLVYQNRSGYYHKTGRKTEALQDLLTLARLDPKDDELFTKIGEYYGKELNDMQRALAWLHQAEALNPNNIEALRGLGIVLGMKGEFARAQDYLFRAHRLAPEDAGIMMNIGINYQNMGDAENARPYLEKAYTINPALKPG